MKRIAALFPIKTCLLLFCFLVIFTGSKVSAQDIDSALLDQLLSTYQSFITDTDELEEYPDPEFFLRDLKGDDTTYSDRSSQVIEESKISSIFINALPQNPQPYQKVKINISGHSIRLLDADIKWTVNGKLVKNGKGETSIEIETEEAGKKIEVVAEIVSTEVSKAFSRRITLIPNEVSLLWEAVDSNTPPFYKGKALPSWGARVKVVALSNTVDSQKKKVGAENLIFSWTSNNFKIEEGYGRTSVYVQASSLVKTNQVSVKASNSPLGIHMSGSISYPQLHPQLVLYEKKPLQGINYEKALVGQMRSDPNETLVIIAEPYFFDTNKDFSSLDISWEVGRRKFFPEGGMRGEIPLIAQLRGRSKLKIQVQSKEKSQRADTELSILVD